MTTEQKPWKVLTTVQFVTWRFLSKQVVIIWNWILLNLQLLCPWSIGVNSGQPHQSVVQMRELEPLQVKKQIKIASSRSTICMVSFSFEQSLWSCIEAGSAILFLMHYKLSATLGVCVRTHLLYVELIHVLYIVRLFSYELNRITTGTIFITSLVWRGPWLGIEPGTSHTQSQHYSTRLSRRRCRGCWEQRGRNGGQGKMKERGKDK